MSEPVEKENQIENQEPTQEDQKEPLGQKTDTSRMYARLLLGALLLSGESFTNLLQNAQDRVESSPGFTSTEERVHAESELDQMRYLLIGSLYQAQKYAAKGLRRGVQFTLRTTGAVLGTFYALTDNSILRPVRRPVDTALSTMARDADQVLRAGRYEEKQSKAVAQETMDELVDELIDYIAENPKVTKAIQEIVGAQGVGMAQMAADDITEKTASGDDALEGFIRRLFRMTPRKDLPGSPIAGQPQYMYLPDNYNPEAGDNNH